MTRIPRAVRIISVSVSLRIIAPMVIVIWIDAVRSVSVVNVPMYTTMKCGVAPRIRFFNHVLQQSDRRQHVADRVTGMLDANKITSPHTNSRLADEELLNVLCRVFDIMNVMHDVRQVDVFPMLVVGEVVHVLDGFFETFQVFV